MPRKRIHRADELERFLASDTFQRIWQWLEAMNGSVQGMSVTEGLAGAEVPVVVERVCALLGQLKGWVDEVPPLSGEQNRFGNRAFRTWYDKMASEVPAMVLEVLSAVGEPEAWVAAELAAYLAGSFGDRTRIDYGTGHEASFLLFMYGLHVRGYVEGASARRQLVLRVLPRYLRVTRKLQLTYLLEPAGSHGVWGLDDYSFLPFLFGSSQLCGAEGTLPPGIVRDRDAVQRLAPDYLYLDAIHFILQMKHGPFSEHSPMLYDISALESWRKVNTGMLRMYRAEVWSKLPVVQHTLFGKLVPYPEEGEEGSRAKEP